MEQVIKTNRAGDVSTYVYNSEGEVVLGADLSSVSAIVYNPYGTELVGITPVVPETDGELTINIPATETTEIFRECRARFTYTYSGEEDIVDAYFSIAPTEFNPPIHYNELLGYDPSIDDHKREDDPTFNLERKSALVDMYSQLKNSGYSPHFIINQHDLSNSFAYLWLAKIWGAISADSPAFMDFHSMYMKRYKELFSSINIQETFSVDPDSDEDKAIPRERIKLIRG